MLLLSAQYALSKARASERDRLESVLAKQERSIRAAFKLFLTETRSPQSMREVRLALESGNITGALAIVNQHVTALGRTISQSFVNVATMEADTLGSKLGSQSRIAVGFDPGNARAASLMRNEQSSFIQQFSTSQFEAVRYALATAYQAGASPQEAASAFRASIGLTRSQLQTVENYRTLLENGSSEALARELRDRRFDPTVERAIQEGDILDASQIDRMVERYREAMLNLRADTIARTEGLSVVSRARDEATRQVVEQAGFDPSTVRRTWRATHDKRTRDSHREMDGQTVGLDEPFETPNGDELMYPGDPSAPARERINCRCSITVDFEG